MSCGCIGAEFLKRCQGIISITNALVQHLHALGRQDWVHMHANSLILSYGLYMYFSAYYGAALKGSAGLITIVLLILLCTVGGRHHRPPD